MIIKTLIRAGVVITGLVVVDAITERFDVGSLKRKKTSVKVESKNKEVKITEEALRQAFEKAHELADKIEEDNANR